MTPIDLSVLADSDGLPEATRLTSCGRRVFVQLRRDDHANPGVPSTLPAVLAVIDLDKTGAERVVDVDPAEVVSETNYWLITHTEFGPGPSSHLNCIGGTIADTTNTFAPEHVNDLALDLVADLLFFPDPCSTATYAACDGGIRVFHAHTGEAATATAVKLDFPPIEVALAR
ncbi:MAG TPA: hypothetical protein VGK67_33465 [Myxococcales bacterium]